MSYHEPRDLHQTCRRNVDWSVFNKMLNNNFLLKMEATHILGIGERYVGLIVDASNSGTSGPY